ncbi:MAG: nuclear transport factor 2 family protein [Maribacter sp.]|nr:nuclear transport factor 2 family protein [Maribacter sp.]
MKYIIPLAIFLIGNSLFPQSNTEVFLLEVSKNEGGWSLFNPKNISNNEGYDNQPAFYDNNTILFSSTRNGQTDIAQYNIATGKIQWLTNTPVGSEYSPLRIPNSDDVSAVRLDTSGLQRLYRYDISTGNSTLIRKEAKVGYHVWYSEDILVNTILTENRMDLIVSNFEEEIDFRVQKNVGRSLHSIPNSDMVSYISMEGKEALLKSLHPKTGKTQLITSIPGGITDMCWWPEGGFLLPRGNTIIKFSEDLQQDPIIINLSEYKNIHSISRISVSPSGKYLALVSEESPAKIVQKQVESYNAGNLEAFINCYSKDVVVRNFPSDTLYVGHGKMRKQYDSLSPEKKVYEVEVKQRIVIGGKVIDEEQVTGKGRTKMQLALYEVANGRIASMNFIFDDTTAENPKPIVQKQVDAYNDRNMEAFLSTYSDDVKVFDFPDKPRFEGKDQMRERYQSFFTDTPDLHCQIKTRMVIANKVIDEEFITANGNNFSAVAIYEVENGKIVKVTFLR